MTDDIGYVSFSDTGVTIDIVRYFRSPRGQEHLERLRREQERLAAKMERRKVVEPEISA